MKRLLILLAGVILILALVLFFTTLIARDRAMASTDQTLAQRAQFIADSLDRTLRQRMIEVFTFAALPSLRGLAASNPIDRQERLPAARAELQSIVAADPSVRAASIIELGGKVLVATDATMNENWGDRLFVREAFRGQLYASVPVREFREVSQYYSAPLFDNAREVAGALVLRIAVQDMWGVLEDEPDLLLIDENGVRIADTSTQPQTFIALEPLSADTMATVNRDRFYGTETNQIRATNLTELASAIRRQSPNVIYHDAKGQTWRAAIAPLKTNSWTVVASASEDSILVPVRDDFWVQLLIALVSVFVGGAAVFIWLIKFGPNEKAHDAT